MNPKLKKNELSFFDIADVIKSFIALLIREGQLSYLAMICLPRWLKNKKRQQGYKLSIFIET
jgi:hypothetical protein